jgi:hypothetical protein
MDDEQTTTNILALYRIRTHGLGVQATKAYASDQAANRDQPLACSMIDLRNINSTVFSPNTDWPETSVVEQHFSSNLIFTVCYKF